MKKKQVTPKRENGLHRAPPSAERPMKRKSFQDDSDEEEYSKMKKSKKPENHASKRFASNEKSNKVVAKKMDEQLKKMDSSVKQNPQLMKMLQRIAGKK